MRTEKPKGLYLLGESAFARIYGADTRRDIEAQVEIVAPLQTPESIAADPSALADVSLIFSGWGMARVDEALLDAAAQSGGDLLCRRLGPLLCDRPHVGAGRAPDKRLWRQCRILWRRSPWRRLSSA